jgi:hypothetical protein
VQWLRNSRYTPRRMKDPMSNPSPRTTSERVAALLPMIRAFLADRYVGERLELKAKDVEELSGPFGMLVASVITADTASELVRSSRRLEKLTYALIALTSVLIAFEVARLLLGR